MRFTLLAGLVALVACSGGEGEQAEQASAPEKPTRVVLISLDTLRGDHFTPELMPLLWARGEKGRRFTRHYSATSTTQPTHATVFTGRSPWETGIERNGLILNERESTLAERLKELGYDTRAVVSSFPLHSIFKFDQGFDHYEDRFTLDRPMSGGQTTSHRPKDWKDTEQKVDGFYSLGDHVTDRAIEALDAMTADHQFLFAHYFDAHGPFGDSGIDPMPMAEVMAAIKNGTAEGAVERLHFLYKQDVRFLDKELERLLVRLDQDADRFETHVIVFSDHGESLGDRGCFGHGTLVSAEQIQVPCLVLSPGLAPEVIDVPVGSIDVFATTLALAGAPIDHSFARDLTGKLEKAPIMGMRRTYVAPKRDLRLNGKVRTIDGKRFYLVDGERVYEGDGDKVVAGHGTPKELPAERAAQVQELFSRLSERLDNVNSDEVMDQGVQDALKALGYAR